jgi:molybdate transport repressor ModE-like protein
MHNKLTIQFETSWLSGPGISPERGRALLQILAALNRTSSLGEAAKTAGMSYRFAWDTLSAASLLFGMPLVNMQRGRAARLSALGRTLLHADERVHAVLREPLDSLRGEISMLLAEPAPGPRPRLALHASHDLAIEVLREACAPRMDLGVVFCGADDGLAALARGECDLAGFHVADALPRAAAAAAAVGRWLDSRKHALIHFATREQGLIVRPKSRIRGVHDLARPGVRFINRGSPGGSNPPDSAFDVAAAVAENRADAGFGLRADATRHKLAFLPLALERYFIAGTKSALKSHGFQVLLDTLKSTQFLAKVKKLPGYDVKDAGTGQALDAALTWVKPLRK